LSVVSTDGVTTSCAKLHGDVALEFCFDCGVDMCPACCAAADGHSRDHRRRDRTDVTAECRRRVAAEMARVTDALTSTYNALLHVDQRRATVLEDLQLTEDLARNECRSAEDSDELERRLRAMSAQKDDDLRQLAWHKELLDVDQTSLETFLKNGARLLATSATTACLLHLVKELKTGAKALLRAHQTRLDQATVDGKPQTSLTGRPIGLLTSIVCVLVISYDRTGVVGLDVSSSSNSRQAELLTACFIPNLSLYLTQ